MSKESISGSILTELVWQLRDGMGVQFARNGRNSISDTVNDDTRSEQDNA